jgi:drug/metabolite transporter (DMT)-like permease
VLTVLAGLGSAFGYAFHDYLMVRVVRAVSVWTALTWALSVGLVVLVPLALLVDGLPQGEAQWQAVAYAAAAGVLEVAGLAALLRGFVTGNLSVVAPLAALAGGFAAAVAIAGGETLTPAAWVGVPLAVAGGALASVERRPDGRRGAHATAGAGWALLCSALFACVLLFFDQASALPPLSVAAWGRISTMLVLVPLTAVVAGLRLPREFRARTIVAGFCDAGGFLLMAVAIGLGPLPVASVTIAQAGTMAALMGFIVLRERLRGLQVAGVILTLLAVTLLALS